MTFMSSTFSHPHHGRFERPEDVLKDDRLSDAEKQDVLDEWRNSLAHILRNDPDAPKAEATRQSLDRAIEEFASGRT